MKLLGTVTFTEGGRTYAWSSREAPPSTVEHPFEVLDAGIIIATAGGPEFVPWAAIEDVRGHVLADDEPAPSRAGTKRRLREPSRIAEKSRETGEISTPKLAKRHRRFRHRPDSADLRERSERRTDAGRERSPAPSAGQQFGHLTAIETAGRDARGRLRWVFECRCGARVTWNVSTVAHNLRRLGWCSCSACYRAAGGWNALAAQARAAAESKESNDG